LEIAREINNPGWETACLQGLADIDDRRRESERLERLADIAKLQDKYYTAASLYARVIDDEPDDAVAYNDRGLAYSIKGDNDRAIADYTKAIEIKPDDAFAYYNRGAAYSDKGDKDRAIADFRKSLKLFTDPNDREDALRELRRLGAE